MSSLHIHEIYNNELASASSYRVVEKKLCLSNMAQRLAYRQKFAYIEENVEHKTGMAREVLLYRCFPTFKRTIQK